MTFRPLHDRVVVKHLDADDKSKGGIIIPDNAKEKPTEGRVIAIGSGKRGSDGVLHPPDVKKGDRIIFGKWSGSEVNIDGDDLMIIAESDIMGIVEDIKTAKKKAA